MDQMRFTLFEVLSLIGVIQCVYIIVYVLFRITCLRDVFLPLLFFFVMMLAFLMDFSAAHIGKDFLMYAEWSWFLWSLITPLSVLLIIQMARLDKFPSFILFTILLSVPAAYGAALKVYDIARTVYGCDPVDSCAGFQEWLILCGAVSSTLCLLVLWWHKDMIGDIRRQKSGKERYWLVISLICINVLLITLSYLSLTVPDVQTGQEKLRNILGLAFLYIITTSLFRIYPYALLLDPSKTRESPLTEDEKQIASKIYALFHLDKVYHEQSYSRTDLARELGVADGTVSRVINTHFKKSFPQLLNEHRVEDAKRLLIETQASVKTVAEEVGFNSLPSFNRVFKDMVGQSPSEYRKNTIK